MIAFNLNNKGNSLSILLYCYKRLVGCISHNLEHLVRKWTRVGVEKLFRPKLIGLEVEVMLTG